MNNLRTAKEIGDKLRVRPATVLVWARQKKIPCIRIGQRTVLFDWDRLQKVLEEGVRIGGRHPTNPPEAALGDGIPA